jgi:hypothetical protein
LFKELKEANIGEIMKIIGLVPRMISEDMNTTLEPEITQEELKSILYSFKRGKSPGLDGLSIKFYLGF